MRNDYEICSVILMFILPHVPTSLRTLTWWLTSSERCRCLNQDALVHVKSTIAFLDITTPSFPMRQCQNPTPFTPYIAICSSQTCLSTCPASPTITTPPLIHN